MKIKTRIEKVFRKTLDDREASILRMRFGLGPDGIPKTLEEVGKAFNITRERIRQIESAALEKIRASGELEKFAAWVKISKNPVAEWLWAEKRGGKI